MNFKQITLDFIEGRMKPEEFDSLLMSESALTEYLQGLIPGDELAHVPCSVRLDELLRPLPEAEYALIFELKGRLEDRSAQDRLAVTKELVELILAAAEKIPDFPDSITMVLGNLPDIIAHQEDYQPKFIERLPDAVLDDFAREHIAVRSEKYTVEQLIANSMHYKEKNRGTLGYYLNLHSAVAHYYTLAHPEESVVQDDTLSQKFGLMLDICPDYIGGTEVEEAGILEAIIAEVPQDMPKSKRIKLLKEKVKAAFHIEARQRPYWLQDPEWPVNDGRPMKFVRTEKKHGGEVRLHHFVDPATGETRIVEDLA